MKGLTKSGKKLMKECLEDSNWGRSCQRVIERHLTGGQINWPTKNGLHAEDANDGITLDDYKLIKATLMVQGKWTA